MEDDLYQILGVPRNADQSEIKRAYRRLVRDLHPDRNPNDKEKEEKFKRVAVAYEILSDPEKRAYYDQYGTIKAPTGVGSDFFTDFRSISDLFDYFFGDRFGFGFSQSRIRREQMGPAYSDGDDLVTELTLTLEETFSQQSKKLKIRRLERCEVCKGSRLQPGTQPTICYRCGGNGVLTSSRQTLLGIFQSTTTCPTCKGKGSFIETPCIHCNGSGLYGVDREVEVGIPAGVKDGTILRISNEGHSGTGGGKAGDILIKLKVKEHPIFTVDGSDLLAELPLTYDELFFGTTLKVNHPRKKELIVKIHPKTQPGTFISIEGEGLPNINKRGAGNLRLLVSLYFPEKLTGEEKSLLESLKKRRLSANDNASQRLKKLMLH